MKKNILLFMISVCTMLFVSCSQDLDYKGEYDVKSYFNGSDPRQNLLSFDRTDARIVIPFIGETCVATEVEGKVVITATRMVAKNERFSLEVVKSTDEVLANYKDANFVTPDKVTFDEASERIAEGGVNGTTTYNVKLEGLNIGDILPIRIFSVDGSSLMPSSNRSLQFCHFSDQQVLTLNQQIFEKSILLTSTETQVVGGANIHLNVLCSSLINVGYTVNIIRDDKVAADYPGRLRAYKIAPDGMFPQFKAQSLDHVNNVDFSFDLIDLASIKESVKYVLPMRVQVLDKNGNEVALLKNKGDLLVQLDFRKS